MSANMLEFNSDPTVVALLPKIDGVRQFADGGAITSAVQYQQAAKQLISIKEQLADFEAARVKITKPINEGLRAVNAQHKETVAPLLTAELTIKRAMIGYSDEQDRIRQEEQRKANEAARKERDRLEAIAAETRRKAEEEAAEKRRQAETAAAAGRAEEAAKLQAQAARVQENAEAKAERFDDRASQVVAPVAQQAAPRVGGISIPMVWVHEVVDKEQIPREYFDLNETRVRKVVQAMQGNTNIPGIRVKQVKRIAAGAA